MVKCWHCHAETTEEHYQRVVYGTGPLYGPWQGWRIAGRYLVGPGGIRVTPERLRGLLWAEARRASLNAKKTRQDPGRVFLLPAREPFDGAS